MEAGGQLYVDITGSEADTVLNIIIEDNGCGIPQEQLKQYNDVQSAIEDDGENIGLNNAFSRIYMYYEGRAFWHVNSVEGMGTVVTLKIPALD